MQEKYNLHEMLEEIARDEHVAEPSVPELVSQDDIAALLLQQKQQKASGNQEEPAG
jgi:hypothetical protein